MAVESTSVSSATATLLIIDGTTPGKVRKKTSVSSEMWRGYRALGNPEMSAGGLTAATAIR